MFYDNYIRLCNSIDKAPSAVAIEIGISKPTVNRWKNGGSPTDATLQKIADYFGVSVSVLRGEEQKEKPAAKGSELSAKRKAFMEEVMQMSDADFERLVQIRRLLETNKSAE